MDLVKVDLFTLAELRLKWAEQRQALLAENVANVSTPGFAPRDLLSFGKVIAKIINGPQGPAAVVNQSLVQTQGRFARTTQVTVQGPAGNGVSLQNQLASIADTQTTQSLVASIYRKYISLFDAALGRN